MAIVETIFDLTYLFTVIFLGVRLLFEAKKEPVLFGVMAVLLGLGDGFHLLPRVISHLDPRGFSAHIPALSYGRMVTSLTMTIFYVLFFYYYRSKSGDRARWKLYSIHLLSLIRIVLVLLPNNNWGTTEESYTFALLRNLPFLIMGLLLVFWSYQERSKDGLKYMAELIFFSFLFYIPVVLFSKTMPAIGALMMPKTLAYLLIVVVGYQHFIKEFRKENILGLSLAFLVTGLMNGVLFREVTKFYDFHGNTHLGKLHVHTLVLGFLMLLGLYLLLRKTEKAVFLGLKKPFYLYISGLIFTISNMGVQGFFDILGGDKTHIKVAALDGMSGIGHILLSLGLIWLMAKIFLREKKVGYELHS